MRANQTSIGSGASGVSVSVFDVGIGIQYFAIVYNFWFSKATAEPVASIPIPGGRSLRPVKNRGGINFFLNEGFY